MGLNGNITNNKKEDDYISNRKKAFNILDAFCCDLSNIIDCDS